MMISALARTASSDGLGLQALDIYFALFQNSQRGRSDEAQRHGSSAGRDDNVTRFWRAMASAMGLRQEFPRQTNRTRYRLEGFKLLSIAGEAQEIFVDSGVGCQLRMKCRDEDAALLDQDGFAFGFGEDFDFPADLFYDGRANENHFERDDR